MDVTPKKIYEAALAFLGKDISKFAPNELGCAEAVSRILIFAGCDLPITISTTELNKILKRSSRWNRIPLEEADAGDVIMSPTGEGRRNGIKNGHTGIFLAPDVIASNDSATGTFTQNYNLMSWKNRYVNRGGYPIYVYRRLGPQAPPVIADDQKAEIATEAIRVATEASKYPSLVQAAINLLKAVALFLKLDRVGAVLGISSNKKAYLG